MEDIGAKHKQKKYAQISSRGCLKDGRVAAFVVPHNKVLDVKTPSALRREHLPVLRRLHSIGNAVAHDLTRQGAGVVRSALAAFNEL